ncbi:DUF4157 domain-containing protein [Streptomyces sp. NPDC127092]|uniref:eCIS core domain-containing protein n=1 Tax=Streptomyces sp. NPDC127092 TaxID=3347135 RepID=UPI00365CD5CD
MRTHKPGKSSDEVEAQRAARPTSHPTRPPATTAAVESAEAASISATALPALQRSAGNAAVVQMMRRAARSGGPGEERHQHDDGCGHHRPGQAPVQRSTVPDVLRSGGRPLDEATRTDMESRMGADFSDVRVHDDAAAQRSAAEIGARAYTSGNHVVIGRGGGDRHTLAHELTHVIQQRQGPVAGTDDGSGLRVSDPSDRFERAAEANARRVLSEPGPGLATAPPATEPVPAQRGEQTGAVQRVRTPDNIQDLWTDGYWEREAGDRPAVAPTAPGGARSLNVILTAVANQLLTALTAQAAREGQKELRVFRTMTIEEADAILEWNGAGKLAGTEAWLREHQGDAQITSNFHAAKDAPGSTVGAMPVRNHLGDMDQAYRYYKSQHDQHYADHKKTAGAGTRVVGGPATRVLEFTLKPGAHELLFSPDNMALSGNSGAAAALRRIFGANRTFPTGSGAEGNLSGYVGMKPEQHGDFSLSLGDTEATKLLFQLFVKQIQDVTSRASHKWNNETTEY